MKLISDSSIAVSKIEDGSVFLVDVQAYNKSLENGADCAHFILSKETWIQVRTRILKFGITGINGISNIEISLSNKGTSIILKQEKIELELSSKQVNALCEAIEEDRFEYANLPKNNFISLEPNFIVKQ